MKVILFGATGMVGQGVLHECLIAGDVEKVLSVGRSATTRTHAKLESLVLSDLTDYSTASFEGYDACFFCLGVSSAGMSEEAYTKITYDLTIAAARAMSVKTFIYVSGQGTDRKSMWSRVKARVENEIINTFPDGLAFRPGAIVAANGEVSRTKLYRIMYPLMAPLLWIGLKLAPRRVLTTAIIGRAMLNAVRRGAPKKVLEAPDIYALGHQ